ncbi:hypothetical protein K3495_g1563 [Podosphaera aphanis]|nr:hypothetical protein K3495_g1563 [Podosphaera aphanis]
MNSQPECLYSQQYARTNFPAPIGQQRTNISSSESLAKRRFCKLAAAPLTGQAKNFRSLVNLTRRKRREGRCKPHSFAYWQRLLSSPFLKEEEKLLVHLRGIHHLEWKDVTIAFSNETNVEKKKAALQMRMTRLLKRMETIYPEDSHTSEDRPEPRNFPEFQTATQVVGIESAFGASRQMGAEPCDYSSEILGMGQMKDLMYGHWPSIRTQTYLRTWTQGQRCYLSWEFGDT